MGSSSLQNLTEKGRAKGRENRWSFYRQKWPEGCKQCTTCNRVLPFSNFSKHSLGYKQLDSRCKHCKREKAKAEWSNKSTEKKILHRTRSRAKKKGLEVNIDLSDIIIPDKCPVFNVDFDDDKFTPSIDRIDSSKGYIKGNIQIISNRANTLKNNGTIEEFEQLLKFLKNS